MYKEGNHHAYAHNRSTISLETITQQQVPILVLLGSRQSPFH
jgi:hypothetical protein